MYIIIIEQGKWVERWWLSVVRFERVFLNCIDILYTISVLFFSFSSRIAFRIGLRIGARQSIKINTKFLILTFFFFFQIR